MANCIETHSDPNVEHGTQMEVIKIKSTGWEKTLQKIKVGTLHGNELCCITAWDRSSEQESEMTERGLASLP